MCKAIFTIDEMETIVHKIKEYLIVLCAGLIIAFLAYFFNDQILGSGKDIMNEALFTDQKSVSWHTVLMRAVGTVIAFNTGAAGGVLLLRLSQELQ